jgi:ribosomal protein L7/L12
MSITPENLPADVVEAIARGETIEAIKRLREHGQFSLKQAKDLVDQYRLGAFAPLQSGSLDSGLPDDVRAALASGRKIEAIKLLRGHTGLGLKEAKDRVDAHEASAPRNSTTAPAAARAGSSWWWLIAVILAAAAAFALLRAPGAEAPL